MTAQKISRMLAKIMGAEPDEVTPDTELGDEERIHPLDLAKWIMTCEREFRLTVHDEDVYRFSRVRDLAQYIDAEIDERGREHGGTWDDEQERDLHRDAWFYE